MAEAFGLEGFLCDELMASLTEGFISDKVLLQASNDFKDSTAAFSNIPPTVFNTTPASSSDQQASSHAAIPAPPPPHRFAPPTTAQQIMQGRQDSIPKKTVQDTKFCLNLWEEWKKNRRLETGEDIGTLTELSYNTG